MNFRFLRDLQPQPDDSTFGNEIYASFIPSAESEGGNPVVKTLFGMSPIASFWRQGTSSALTLARPRPGFIATAIADRPAPWRPEDRQGAAR